jgi:hypothetical protein
MMHKAMRNRRLFLWPASVGVLFGVTSFLRVAGKPRFETMHMLDVIGLMTSGACIAVTIMALVMFFTFGPRTDDNRAGEKSGEASN